ncbi:unnamed protein product [Leuciscus chuanchicus]
MASLSEDDISCIVCCEIFKAPVLLSCSHSFCKECIQQFWRTKETQECPVCRRLSRHEPSNNLVLKNLCESFLKERNERRSSGTEKICSLHSEKLKLFCLEDKQSVCLVCINSQKHDNHKFRPIGEVVSSYREELNTALKSLQEKLKHNENIKGEFEKTVQHIKSQAEHTERQIKQQFEKLHQFLRDEEEATITALREEEEQKKQTMKGKLEEMNTHISDLSHTIKDMEDMMKANDVCFLKEFPVSMERVQISQPDPQMASGALIHVPRYLGNLPFRVWKKMQDIVQNTPVILDPNSAHPRLVLSDDLTSVRDSWNKQPLPDNPERFDFHCVLGSEGFNSGTHSWDVEVKKNRCWRLGVTTASNQRKGDDFFNSDVWSVQYDLYKALEEFGFHVKQKLERVRVDLDYDRGIVSFSDPVTNTHLHTFTTTFPDTLFPFFCCWSSSLRILPEFPVSMERVQISQPDPQMASGALIHVSRFLGNLPFRVWKKMQDIVQNTPVILDPNTANPQLVLSDDLTSVRYSRNKQLLPDNPERFDIFECVLGSEGFNSGTHSWDVEVKESRYWRLGVTTASNQRKGDDFFNTDVWRVQYRLSGSGFHVEQKLERVRVDLDYDRGTVSFSDPVTNTHLHTFTSTFTDTLFPFFCCSSSLRILPVNSQ